MLTSSWIVFIYITSQYSVIHHMFLLYSIMHLRLLLPHNPNSPSQVVCHSIHEWQPAFVIPPALKSHLLQNASVAVSINEKTSEIHITGLSKKRGSFVPTVVIFHQKTPPLLLLSSFDTITHLGHHSMTRIWKVLRFSYNRHQRWFVCVKHCLMRGSLDPNIDPKTSVQIPEKGYEYNFKCIFKG